MYGFPFVATALYTLLSGIINIPASFLFLITSQFSTTGEILYTVLSILSFIFGVILLAATVGLWTLQEWGRKATIWVSMIEIPIGIIFIFPVFPNQKITTILQTRR